MDIRSIVRGRYLRSAVLAFLILAFMLAIVRQYRPDNGWYKNAIYWGGAYYLILALLLPITSAIFLKNRFSKLYKVLVTYGLTCLLLGIGHFFLTGVVVLLLERLLGWPEHYEFESLFEHFQTNWLDGFDSMFWFIAYLVLLHTIYYYIQYTNQKDELSLVKSKLATSNVEVMSAQLNPHFVFNAMNTISMMVRRNENKKAVNMIAALSDTLRAAMSKQNDQMVLLESEVELLEKYLTLEKERFKERVDINTSFSKDAKTALVPKMILQPIVENAFKHGVSLDQSQSIIEIRGEIEGKKLLLSVFNSGKASVDWDISTSSSLGLPNTIHRLRTLYDKGFEFKVIEQSDGVLFQINLPFKTSV